MNKRILVLVDWFIPGYKAGGPIQSCLNFALNLQKHFDINVLTTDTDHGEIKPYVGIISNSWICLPEQDVKVFYIQRKKLSITQLKKLIIDSESDFIYLNHLFSPYFVLYPLWLKITGKLKCHIVLCPRGALYDSALSVKYYKKRPLLALMRLIGLHKKITFHATNEREKSAINRFFPGSKIIIADNLPKSNQPIFVSCEKQSGILRAVFISRIVPIKNLLFLLKVLRTVNVEILLTIVGPLEDKEYWSLCEREIGDLPRHISVSYAGSKSNEELNDILTQNHLFILPTTGENFGHAIFEALLAGRPVLISDQTPWLNLQEKWAGWDLALDQPSKFADCIEKVARWDQQEYDKWARGAYALASQFIKNQKVISQYLELFK